MMVGKAEALTWHFHPWYYAPLKAVPRTCIKKHTEVDIAIPSSSYPVAA